MAIGKPAGRGDAVGALGRGADRGAAARTRWTLWAGAFRILIGCLIIPVVFWLRRSLEETDAFLSGWPPAKRREVFQLVAENWRLIGIGVMMSILTHDNVLS